jgi:hypothetical protein
MNRIIHREEVINSMKESFRQLGITTDEGINAGLRNAQLQDQSTNEPTPKPLPPSPAVRAVQEQLVRTERAVAKLTPKRPQSTSEHINISEVRTDMQQTLQDMGFSETAAKRGAKGRH